MSIEIKTRTIIIGLLIAFVATFAGGWLLGRYDKNNSSETIISGLNDIITTYAYQVYGLEKKAAERETLIMSQKQAIKAGLVSMEELRKLKIKYATDVTHFQSEIEILLDSIHHEGPVVISPCPPDENHPVLYLPMIFGEQNDFLDLKGEFDVDGKLSMKIKMPLSVDVYTGWDKSQKVYKTVVSTDNPYVTTMGIQSVQLDLQKPRRWGIGAVGGYGFAWGNSKLQPFIGLELSWNVIQF